MRDLKFRAWDIDVEQMYYQDTPYEDEVWQIDNSGIKLLVLTTVDSFPGGEYHKQEDRYLAPAQEIMQFTGFSDRHDKDIYEGDIVKFHYFYMGCGENMGATECEAEVTGVIEWSTFGWAVKNISGKHWEGYTGYGAGEGESNIIDLYAMNEGSVHEESFEKIGNIHENPELLK